MDLINPNFLWGLAAIAAPILIHFWNQKQAKNIDWAAMKWLVESQKLKAKGFRFEDLTLLILRLLAIILLVLIVSKPLVNMFQKNNDGKLSTIHILARDKATTENYKFEISEALRKKEPVFWIDNLEEKLSGIDSKITEKEIQITDLQNISKNNSLDFSRNKLILYLPNDINLNENPNVFLPKNTEIYFSKKIIKDETKVLETDVYIYVNADKKLVKSPSKPSVEITKKKEIKVAIETLNQTENNNIKAAFEAIKEVYGFPFVYDKKDPEIAIGYSANRFKNSDLIILTNGLQSASKNAVSLNENPTSGNVFRAELPEQILEILLKHYQLFSLKNEWSNKQLKDVFIEKTKENRDDKTLIDKYLCMLFLAIVMIERWISLKNNK